MTAIKNYRMSALALLALIVVSAIPAYAQFSVLYNFGSQSVDPSNPSAILVQGRDGALYGTSNFGGANGLGVVFKSTPPGTTRVLYNFCSQTNCADGSRPADGLTLRPDGHFIGAASTGGNGGSNGNGTIFDITQTGSLTVLYRFTGGTDGAGPASPIPGLDGSYYGTTATGGGASGCGTIYKITNAGASYGGFTLLHDFNSTDGCTPFAKLVLGTDGNFYGVTYAGGTSGLGVVFRCTPAGKVTVLYNFNDVDGFNPYGPLIQGGDGNFYGTTSSGGINTAAGTIFQITPTGTYTTLYALNGTTDGSGLRASLEQATDGNFYGVTAGEGTGNNKNCAAGCGTLFQVTAEGSYSVLYNFDFTTGYEAFAAPVQHTNGLLYGVTFAGGTGASATCVQNGSCGVLYSWDASLPPFVSTVPFMAKVGSFVEILGQGFNSTTTVSFNGTPATATVVSGTYLRATVPAGATTGPVTVTTSGGTLTSNRQFVVTP